MPNNDTSILPWHSKARALWANSLHEEKLPTALILAGAGGLGKGKLAEYFARSALCLDPGTDQQPCGQCVSCLQYLAGSHPDFFRLTPETEGKSILVDQVRAFTESLYLTSQHGG